jgi:hypothetical protein
MLILRKVNRILERRSKMRFCDALIHCHTKTEKTEIQIGFQGHVTGSCLMSAFGTGKRASRQECFGCLQIPDAENRF